MCGSAKHLRYNCPLRKQRPTPMGRNPVLNLKPGMARGKFDTPLGAGRPTGVELSSVTSLGGRIKQDLAPLISVPYSAERGYKPGLLVVEVTVKGFEKH